MSRSTTQIAIAAVLLGFAMASGSASGAAAATTAAAPAAAKKSDEENEPRQTDKRSQKMETARVADEKRKAEEKRKQEEMERLASEAEEDRKQAAIRLAQDKKKRELQRQPVDPVSRCVLKPVMTDAEIARCK
jgi:hypothetical protein